MHQHRCPIAEVNKTAHGQFLEAFQNFKNEYHQTGATEELTNRMYSTLTGWLVNRIQKVDTSIKDCPSSE